MVVRAVVIAIVVMGTVAAARADSAKLAQARAAIDAVQFEEAQRLLATALAEGGNSSATVRQIYELSANVAAVLGQRDLAEQYYRRWLALEPTAQLGSDVSPKLAEAFVAAQAYMAAHGRLVASARRRGEAIEVTVESDPVGMAASANGVAFGPDHRATVGGGGASIAILDERGNQLLDVAVAVAAADVATVAPREKPPVLARWQTWSIAAGAVLLTGAIWGAVAVTEHNELLDDRENSGSLFFTDYDRRYQTMRRNATISIAVAGAGTLLAIPAAILYVKSRRPSELSRFAVGPAPGGGIAVGIGARF